jgi:hypothetical protein
MKKELKEGMGFICANLEDKKRIWQRLTDAGYPMRCDWDDSYNGYKTIGFWRGEFSSFNSNFVTDPLNESDFFDDWTPQAGEWVYPWDDEISWNERQYLCTINGVHLCVSNGGEYKDNSVFITWKHIRQIKPETMTLQEVREALGKPNLVIEG